MQRVNPVAPCACDQCSQTTSTGDRLTLWIVVIAILLLPGRAIVAGLLS